MILILLFFFCLIFVFFIYPKYIKPKWTGHTKCEKIYTDINTYIIPDKTKCKPYPWYELFHDLFRIFEKNPTILS